MPTDGPGGPSPLGEVQVRRRTGPSVASGAAPGSRPSLGLIFAITVTGISGNSLLASSVPTILRELGENADRAGVLVASGTLAGILMAPVIGVLADRYGRRDVLVPCLALFGAAGGLTALAPDFETLLALRFVQGIGSAGLINLAVVIVGDYWTGADRARIIGLNAAVLTVSLAVLPPLGGAITELAGWRFTLAPYAMGVVTAVVVLRQLPSVRYGDPDRSVGDHLRASFGYARSPLVLALVATGFVVFILIFGLLLTALPLRLEDEFGLGASAIGGILAISALTSALVASNLGRLRRRVPARRLIVAGLVAQGASLLAVGGSPSLVALGLGVALFGLGEGLLMPTLQDVVAGAAPDEGRGTVMAVWVGGARAGQTAGGLLLTAGLAAGLTVPGAFVIGAVLAWMVAGAHLVVTRRGLLHSRSIVTGS